MKTIERQQTLTLGGMVRAARVVGLSLILILSLLLAAPAHAQTFSVIQGQSLP